MKANKLALALRLLIPMADCQGNGSALRIHIATVNERELYAELERRGYRWTGQQWRCPTAAEVDGQSE